MITKSKATLTGIAALFALSALSSQAHAGGDLVFSPGSNQGPPACQGPEGPGPDGRPGAILGGGSAADRAEATSTVNGSTVGGGPSEVNGVVYALGSPSSGPECGVTPLIFIF
jgi:hypothetical protein